MARKKLREPSPSPPPPTPAQEESSSDEEEEEATPATQKAPQNPKPQASDAADADSSDGGEEDESSDSEADANAFQMRQLAPSTGKPSESDEDGSSSEPIQARKSGKKRQAAADPSPSGGKAKKAKAADLGKAAAPPPSELKGAKKKKRDKAVPADRSPSKPAVRRWTVEDEIKILEALVSHVKANGTQPGAGELIAAVGHTLERKNCSKTEMYEKVRNLKQRHEKAASTGTLPGNEDDLRKFNLSEAVWGETAKEVAALTVSQKDGASSKSNKGKKINKEKAKEPAATTDTPAKSKKKRGKELEDDPKADATKETTDAVTHNVGTSVRSGKPDKEKKNGDAESLTPKEATATATQNVGTSVRSGKPDKEKKNGDAQSLTPKKAIAVTQNGGDTLSKNGETHQEKMDTDPNVENNMRKRFDELQNLYPNLSSYVESIHAQHPCGETLKRAFENIADEKACALEAKIKKQRVAEMKMDTRRADTKKEVTNLMIGLLD